MQLKRKINKIFLLSASLSLILHTSAIAAIYFLVAEKSCVQAISATKKSNAGQQNKKGEQVAVPIEVIVTKTPTLKNGTKKTKIGFWGIGISIDIQAPPINYMGQIIFGDTIDKVYENYPADRAGLMSGDTIISVKGDGGNVRGEGPAKLELLVYRNGKVFKVLIEREQILIESP